MFHQLRLLDVIQSQTRLFMVFEYLNQDLKKYMDTVPAEGIEISLVKVIIFYYLYQTFQKNAMWYSLCVSNGLLLLITRLTWINLETSISSDSIKIALQKYLEKFCQNYRSRVDFQCFRISFCYGGRFATWFHMILSQVFSWTLRWDLEDYPGHQIVFESVMKNNEV